MSKQMNVSERFQSPISVEDEGFDALVDLDMDHGTDAEGETDSPRQFTAEGGYGEGDGFSEIDPVIEFSTQHGLQSVVEDERLMRDIAGGDAAALSRLYDRYAPNLKSVALGVVHDDAEADDLLQEVFIQIWKQAQRYSPDKGRPLGWIVTLTRRRAIDRLRKRKTYWRAKDRFEMSFDQQPRVFSQTEADVHLADMRRFLNSKLDLLPAFQRQAIEMAFFEGKSQREIALATETSLGTIKTRLELGLKKLSGSVRGIRNMI